MVHGIYRLIHQKQILLSLRKEKIGENQFFTTNAEILEKVDDITYIGITVNYNGKFGKRFKTFGPHEGFLTHQLINIENKQIANKAYDESEMRTRQKRIVTPGEPQGVKQYH